MIKNLEDFKDEKGFILQKRREGRYNAVDANFYNSNYLYHQLHSRVKPSKKEINHFFDNFTTKNNELRRYWKDEVGVWINDAQSKIWTNPKTVSRDNSMGYLILAGETSRKPLVKQFCWNVLKRGSFFQNTLTNSGERKIVPDFCGFSTWAILLRAAFEKTSLTLMYPLLMFLDIFLFIQLAWHVVKSRIPRNKENPLDYHLSSQTSTCFHELSALVLIKKNCPTIVSKLATYVYLNLRNKEEGFYDKEPVISALKYMSRAKYDPPIYEMARNAINFLRKK